MHFCLSCQKYFDNNSKYKRHKNTKMHKTNEYGYFNNSYLILLNTINSLELKKIELKNKIELLLPDFDFKFNKEIDIGLDYNYFTLKEKIKNLEEDIQGIEFINQLIL